jgi:hypothetical protein
VVRWSKNDLELLDSYLKQGLNYKQAASRLGRTLNSILIIRKRRGIASITERFLTTRKVAKLLGIPCSKVVTRWIQKGYLKARRTIKRGPNYQWGVEYEDLYNFVVNPLYSHLFYVDDIKDVFLKQAAIEICPLYFTTGQVAKRLNFCSGTINLWINRGIVKGSRRGNWLISSNELTRLTDLINQGVIGNG